MKNIRPSKKHSLPKLPGSAVAHSVKHKVTRHVTRRLERRKLAKSPLEAISNLPRITNETVAEHREEVLSSARKYIYPLQHSRDRVIKVSVILFITAVVAFFAYCGLALYKFQASSTFIYEVTRVIPFPVARAGSHFVSYESYLFELRHLTHYYETQQNEDFSNESGSRHLAKLKQDSLQKVIDNAYVKELARKNNISISNREVEDQIALVKSQNRLGSSDQMLGDVLRQFWGWSLDDFKRELKSQLLVQKVASELDTAAHAKAANALAEVQGGADFAAVAAKYSEDEATKTKGGLYPSPINKTNRDVPPHVVDALFRLDTGQTSGVVETGFSLEIVKNVQTTDDKVQGAHISFKLQPISRHIEPLKKETRVRHFISV
ncbi:MAG TPA: peptidylprolyl isomerase [Candidatus Saccharimonadales bacterium]|jgi:hypothetical protein